MSPIIVILAVLLTTRHCITAMLTRSNSFNENDELFGEMGMEYDVDDDDQVALQNSESIHGLKPFKDIDEGLTWFQHTLQTLRNLSNRQDGKFLNLWHQLICNTKRLVLNTDYSGLGMPEIASYDVCKALRGMGEDANVVHWRASDISPKCRNILKTGCCQSRHVFGDLFSSRIGMRTRAFLRNAYKELEESLRQSGQSESLYEQLGQKFMEKVVARMQTIQFKPDASGWCYKCDRVCQFKYNSDTQSTDDEPSIIVNVAGTTCTSWSTMGSGHHWTAWSAVIFVVWAFATLAEEPHIILHECTAAFDESWLHTIFGAYYIVQSMMITPDDDLGYPSSRRRTQIEI